MTRLLPVALFAALAVGVASLAPAQDPKPKEKEPAKPARIAVSEPKDLAEDKDFAIQGEYAGRSDCEKFVWGVQVVAKGDGKFDVKIHDGGLPGEVRWDSKSARTAKAARTDAGIEVKDGDKAIGTIADGAFKIALGDFKGTLKKVNRTSPTLGAKPPEGAEVLFGKAGDEANWDNGKLVKLSDGEFLNMGIKSKKSFGSFKAHCEFRLPWMPNSTGQQRGNSGFYLQDRYEVQVLDSFGLKGENNECGGVYTLAKPSVNMCLPPMAWQTYDIDFTAAVFEGDKKVKPAVLTLLHNGVKIHDQVELKNATGGGQPESAKPGPIQLQNHGDPLVYRNIWVVETK